MEREYLVAPVYLPEEGLDTSSSTKQDTSEPDEIEEEEISASSVEGSAKGAAAEVEIPRIVEERHPPSFVEEQEPPRSVEEYLVPTFEDEISSAAAVAISGTLTEEEPIAQIELHEVEGIKAHASNIEDEEGEGASVPTLPIIEAATSSMPGGDVMMASQPSEPAARHLCVSIDKIAEQLALKLGTREAVIAEDILEPSPEDKMSIAASPDFHQPFARNDKLYGGSGTVGLLLRLWNPEVTRKIAVVGLGGIGKTELVIEFTYRLKAMSSATSISWFAPEDLISSHNSGVANCSSRLDQWLQDDHKPGSLIIVDSGVDYQVLELPNERGTLVSRLKAFNGTVLLLARSRQIGGLLAATEDIIEVHCLEQREAVGLLRDRLTPASFEYSTYQQLVDIVQLVSCVPRATIQIANAIKHSAMRVHQFYDLYLQTNEMKLQLFGTLNPLWKVSEPDSVVGTGVFDLGALQIFYPPAAKIFYQLFILGGASIPRSLVAALVNPLELVIIVTILKGHFVMSEDIEMETLNIHPLVYLAMTKQLQCPERILEGASELKAEIFKIFAQQYPDEDTEDRTWWRGCFANSFLDSESDDQALKIATAAIHYKESKYLHRKGHYTDALHKAAAAENAISIPIPVECSYIVQYHCELLELLGHYDEAREKCNLHDERLDPLWKARFEACLLTNEGAHALALEKYRSIKVATEATTSLPSELYESMSDYAFALFIQGKVQEAEVEGRNAYKCLRSQLGAEYSGTLKSARNLAQILKGCGRFEEAIDLAMEAERGFDRICGDDLLQKAWGWICRAQILLAVAVTKIEHRKIEELLVKSVAKLRDCLGDLHPGVLRCRSALAVVLLARGDLASAIDLNRLVLSAQKQGPWLEPNKHPDTILSRHQLAVCLRQVYGCRNIECSTLSEQVLIERSQTLSNRTAEAEDFHPDQLASLMHHAIVLSGQDQAASALEKIKLVLKGIQANLGAEHPDTFVAMSWLGEIMRTQLPRHERSQTLDSIDALQNTAVDGLTLSYGSDHHLTLESKTHMAAARRERGSSQGFKDAEMLYRQVYLSSKRTRSEGHVETLRAKTRLADVMHLFGVPSEETRRLWREAVAGMAVTCGVDGYDTLVAHKGYEKFLRGLKD